MSLMSVHLFFYLLFMFILVLNIQGIIVNRRQRVVILFCKQFHLGNLVIVELMISSVKVNFICQLLGFYKEV